MTESRDPRDVFAPNGLLAKDRVGGKTGRRPNQLDQKGEAGANEVIDCI